LPAIEDTAVINVVIVGTAGQGVITLKRLIEFVAAEADYEGIFGSEMHGLAQREGAVACHCRLQRCQSENPRANIFSPTVCYGDADLVIGLEPIEVLRNAGQFSSEKTTFVVNERTIPPILVTAGKETYPSIEDIQNTLLGYGGPSDGVLFMNATDVAINAFSDAQKMNMVMFGFAMATRILDFDTDTCERVVRREMRDAETNIAAIALGFQHGEELLEQKKDS
jgi:indolepyruvate ferredoxin oxidoreductase beta subunit